MIKTGKLIKDLTKVAILFSYPLAVRKENFLYPEINCFIIYINIIPHCRFNDILPSASKLYGAYSDRYESTRTKTIDQSGLANVVLP